MKRFAILALAALIAVMLLATTSIAFADPRGEAKGYDGQRGKSTQSHGRSDGVAEDNDEDGVPNAPDPEGDADNRHPSGKDKHEEAGASGNQGASTSTPDQNGSGPERDEGGTDKPDGSGGADILDQDGNNGCGNDDDFDDDNEGWCGKPLDVAPVTPPTEVEVEGERETRDETAVLGERVTRGVQVQGALATTGAAIATLALAGLAFTGAGAALRVIRRRS